MSAVPAACDRSVRSSWTLPVEEAPAKLSPCLLLGTKTWARLQNQTCASASRLPICRSPNPPPHPPHQQQQHHSTTPPCFSSSLPLSFCRSALLYSQENWKCPSFCSVFVLPFRTFSSPLIDETRQCGVWWATLTALGLCARRVFNCSTKFTQKKKTDGNLAAG